MIGFWMRRLWALLSSRGVMNLPVGIVHRCRMHWPPGHKGIQFGAHIQPGWSSLNENGNHWRHNVCLEFAVWRVDIGIGRDQ